MALETLVDKGKGKRGIAGNTVHEMQGGENMKPDQLQCGTL